MKNNSRPELTQERLQGILKRESSFIQFMYFDSKVKRIYLKIFGMQPISISFDKEDMEYIQDGLYDLIYWLISTKETTLKDLELDWSQENEKDNFFSSHQE